AGNWVDDIKNTLAGLKVGAWDDPEAALGPLISPAAKERVSKLIETGVKEGAKLLLDGRDCKVASHPKGNFIGPTMFDNVTPEMTIYKEEIFGPSLLILRAGSLEEA